MKTEWILVNHSRLNNKTNYKSTDIGISREGMTTRGQTFDAQ